MGIEDTAGSLLRKSKRRRERHDLQKLGVRLGAEFVLNRNEELQEKNDRFLKSDESLWQRQVDFEDAATDSEWFIGERVTGREHARGLLGHVEDMSANTKIAQITAALGERGAKQYDINSYARSLAEEDAPELLKLFEDGHHHAATTDWDMAKFEDFLALKDGNPDNVGGEAWKIMTSPFRDQADEITARDLAETIEKSRFGKDAVAMLTFRKALKEGLSISTAVDFGEAMKEYRIPDKIKSEKPFEATEGQATAGLGTGRILEVEDVYGNNKTITEFGSYLSIPQIRQLAETYGNTAEDNLRYDPEAARNFTTLADNMELEGDTRQWFPNEESNEKWHSGNLFGWHLTEDYTDAAGQKHTLHERAIFNQDGSLFRVLSNSPENYLSQPGRASGATSRSQFEAAATQGQIQEGLENLTSSLVGYFNIGTDGKGETLDSDIQDFLHMALGIVEASTEAGLTAASGQQQYNRLGQRIFGVQENLKLIYGSTIDNQMASDLATALVSQQLISGLERENGGFTPMGFLGGFEYDYNTPMNLKNGISSYDILHAYVSAEASGRNAFEINESFLVQTILGSMGVTTGLSDEQKHNRRQNQLEEGSFSAGYTEVQYGGQDDRLINHMRTLYEENRAYGVAMDTVLDSLGVTNPMAKSEFLNPWSQADRERFVESMKGVNEAEEEYNQPPK